MSLGGKILSAKIKSFSKKDIFIFALMFCTAVLITVTAIYFNQKFLMIMPLYVSLVIGMLQSKVNRYSCLLGSANSLIYGVVYFYYNLYASALSAVLFSCPIQLITFIRWNRNKRGNSTKLNKLTLKQKLLLAAGYVVLLVLMWKLLPLIGAEYVFLDSASNILGIFIYFLTMFAFVEYTFCMIINGILTIILYITMLPQSPDISTHLIFAVYSFVCICFAFFEARKLYKSQRESESR